MKQHSGIGVGESLYLDIVRFIAAATVFVGHLTSFPFDSQLQGLFRVLGHADTYGAAAVAIFFVLSGFVIAYVIEARENDGASYAISRVSRMFSVVIPVLILTFVFDYVGRGLDPELYRVQKVLWEPVSVQSYVASFFLVNEYQAFGFDGIAPGTNGPYWSLSFEATYYLVAGLLLFAPRWFGIAASVLILTLAGRTIVMLFPLWAAGFYLYRYRGALAEKVRYPLLTMALTAVALLVVPMLFDKANLGNFGVRFPFGRGNFNRELLCDYAVGAIFTLHLVASVSHFRDGTGGLDRRAKLIRWLGGITFPLYAVHFPALCFFAALVPSSGTLWADYLYVSAGVFAVVIVLTPLTDALKRELRSSLGPPLGAFARAKPGD